MASIAERLKQGLDAFGKDLDKSLPENGKVKTAGRYLDKGIDAVKEEIPKAKKLAGDLAQKGKDMLTGNDVKKGLK